MDRGAAAPRTLMVEVTGLDVELRPRLRKARGRLYIGDVLFWNASGRPTFIANNRTIDGLGKVFGSDNLLLFKQMLDGQLLGIQQLRLLAITIEAGKDCNSFTKVQIEINLDSKWVAMMEPTLNIALKVRPYYHTQK